MNSKLIFQQNITYAEEYKKSEPLFIQAIDRIKELSENKKKQIAHYMKFGPIDFTIQPEFNSIYDKYFNPKTLLLIGTAILGTIMSLSVPQIHKELSLLRFIGTAGVLRLLCINGTPKGLQIHFSHLLQDRSRLYNFFDFDNAFFNEKKMIKELFQSLLKSLYQFDDSVFLAKYDDIKKTENNLSLGYTKLIKLIKFQDGLASKIQNEINYENSRGYEQKKEVSKTDSNGKKYFITETTWIRTSDEFRLYKLRCARDKIKPDKSPKDFITNLALYYKLANALNNKKNNEGGQLLQIIENSDEYKQTVIRQEELLSKIENFVDYFSLGSSWAPLFAGGFSTGINGLLFDLNYNDAAVLSLFENALKNTRNNENELASSFLDCISVPPRPFFINEISEQLFCKHATAIPLHEHWNGLVKNFNKLNLLQSKQNFFDKVKGAEWIYARAFLLSVVMPLAVSQFSGRMCEGSKDKLSLSVLDFFDYIGKLYGGAKIIDLAFCEQRNIEFAKLKLLSSKPHSLITSTDDEQLFVPQLSETVISELGADNT
jgi:hypothetical protein